MRYVNWSRTQILIVCLNEAATQRWRYLKIKITVSIKAGNNVQKWERVQMQLGFLWRKRFNGEKLNMLNILRAMVWKDVNVILNTSRYSWKDLVRSQTGTV